jgi:hypothetical protein
MAISRATGAAVAGAYGQLRDETMRRRAMRSDFDLELFGARVATMRAHEQQATDAAGSLMTTAAIVGGTIAAAVTKLTTDMDRVRADLDKYHTGALPAASLPAYISNLPGFKKRSISLSETYGIDVDQVNAMRAAVGSNMPDQSAAVRELTEDLALKFQQTTGAGATDVATLIDDVMDAGAARTPRVAANLIESLRTKGSLSIAEQQAVLPNLLPHATRMGIKPEEVTALASMTTAMGGNKTRLSRAILIAMSRADDFQKKGLITGKGGAAGMFKELSELQKSRPEVFAEALGDMRAEAATAAHYIASHQGEYSAAVDAARKDLYGGDMIGQVQQKLLHDPETRHAIDSLRTEQREKNRSLRTSLGEQKVQGWWAQVRSGMSDLYQITDDDSGLAATSKFLTKYSGARWWLPLLAGGGTKLANEGLAPMVRLFSGGMLNPKWESAIDLASQYYAAPRTSALPGHEAGRALQGPATGAEGEFRSLVAGFDDQLAGVSDRGLLAQINAQRHTANVSAKSGNWALGTHYMKQAHSLLGSATGGGAAGPGGDPSPLFDALSGVSAAIGQWFKATRGGGSNVGPTAPMSQ